MTAREVIGRLRKLGCSERKGKGAHVVFLSPSGHCRTTVSKHSGDIPKGTLHAIHDDMEHCLGKGWLWQ